MVFFNSFCCFTVVVSDKVSDCSTTQTSNNDNNNNNNNNFSWDDIASNLSCQIGSGGFSTVYLSHLPGLTAAVKIQSTCTERLAQIHDQERQILSQLKHPNIVKFLGHCSSNDKYEDQCALLFEYAPNGTLHDRLHNRGRLTWKTRTLIAFQSATALEYLHDVMHIIHGDIKASNILLDEKLNCKLCDFGSAKIGFTSMVLPPSSTKMSRVMILGSQGYMDPHYLKTGLVSNKNDVYSFGVVLLELITGREAFSAGGEKLTEIMRPVVNGDVGVEEMVDPRLRCGGDGFDLEEVKDMVMLAGKCIGCTPMVRPSAAEIVASMKNKFKSLTHL